MCNWDVFSCANQNWFILTMISTNALCILPDIFQVCRIQRGKYNFNLQRVSMQT